METSPNPQNSQAEQAPIRQEAEKAISEAYQAAADFMKELDDY